jgi:hypothetical protein
MGKSRGPYKEEFPTGTRVQIAGREHLEQFSKEWKYHNPLKKEQLAFASQFAIVKTVSFYHGGDELYELKELPGLWHEQCLHNASDENKTF